jgi:hypothetical protein
VEAIPKAGIVEGGGTGMVLILGGNGQADNDDEALNDPSPAGDLSFWYRLPTEGNRCVESDTINMARFCRRAWS